MATVGRVSNPDSHDISIGKAGRKRWMAASAHRGVLDEPDRFIRTAAAKAAPRAAVIRCPRGLPHPRQEDTQQQVAQKFIVASPARAQRRSRGRPHDAFGLKGPFVDGYCSKKAEAGARIEAVTR